MFDLTPKANSLSLSSSRASLYLGLSSLALLATYILTKQNKKDTDEEEDTSYVEIINSRSSVSEIKVPFDCVRAIIGPQGANIKEIQKTTNTRINFKEKNIGSDDSEKTLVIRGSSSNIQQAELEVKRFILDMPYALVEEFYVPDSACGKIIGKQGANIKEIIMASNCQIKLDNRFSSGRSSKKNNAKVTDIVESPSMTELNYSQKKVITLIGSVEQINSAKNLIISKIKEDLTFRERRQKKDNLKQTIAKNNYMQQVNSSDSSNPDNIRTDDQLFDLTNSESLQSLNSVKPLELPPVVDLESCLGDKGNLSVLVTAVAHPAAFWVQLCGESTRLEQLKQDMNKYYAENTDNSFKSLEELKFGTMAATNYSHENSWYRVEIKGIETKKNKKIVDVYFVDYGDMAYIDLKHLRKLPEQFYEVPLQAIKCQLDGVSPWPSDPDEFWTEEAIACFEDNVFESGSRSRPIELTIVKYESSLSKKTPSVLLTDTSKGVDISDLLINNGLCKSTNASSLIDSSELLVESKTVE